MADTTTTRRRSPAKKTTTAAKKTAAAADVQDEGGNRASRRATARKAPAKKTSTAQAKKAAADKATAGPRTETISFYGRTLTVRPPSPDELAMWRVYFDRLQSLGAHLISQGSQATSEDGQKAIQVLSRVISLVQSLLPNQVDKTWIEDQILDQQLSIVQAAEIVQMAMEKFRDRRQQQATSAGPAPAKSRARRG